MSKRGIALLSGGMDSVTAMYIAHKTMDTEIVAAVSFDYGQHGSNLEYRAAAACLVELRGMAAPLIQIRFNGPDSGLTRTGWTLEPDKVNERGLPLTWVPARNMIMLALAGSRMERYDANVLVGGWVGEDNAGYPDCREDFLESAQQTLSLALDRHIVICRPVVQASKKIVVLTGEELGVPWALTRSCYGGGEQSCLECDSCRRRINAFILAGVRDPLVSDEDWKRLTTEVLS